MVKLRPGFSHKAACGFGVIHLQFGVDCIAVGIAAAILPCSIDVPILAISSGVLFVLTGAACLFSVWKKTDSWIITSLVLSIISAVLSLVLLIDCGLHIPYLMSRYDVRYIATPRPPELEELYHSEKVKRISINALVAVLALMEGVLAIITSGFSCRTLCCQKPEMYAYHPIPMVSLPTGQFSNLLPTAMPVYSDQSTAPLEEAMNASEQGKSLGTEVNGQHGTVPSQALENSGQLEEHEIEWPEGHGNIKETV